MQAPSEYRSETIIIRRSIMDTSDCSTLIELRSTSFRASIYSKCRLLVSVLVGLMVAACEGGSIALQLPEISSAVPALPDDDSFNSASGTDSVFAVDEALANHNNTQQFESMPVDNSQQGFEELAMLSMEGSQDSESLMVGGVDMLTLQSPNVVTAAAPATTAGISAQAQALLRGALSRGGVRIMPTGDAITHGAGGSASYRRELGGLLDAAGCVYRMVGSQSQSLGDTGYYGAHEGYSGHTADNFLTGRQTSAGNNSGIADAVNFQSPDLVLLHIGSVDLFQGQTVTSTVDDIAMVIDTIYQNKPDTVVIVANVIPWFNDTRDSSLPDSIRMLGTELQELVRRSSNPLISIADVRTGFSEDMMQADLIHPNDEGDAHIANAIFNSYYSDSVCR